MTVLWMADTGNPDADAAPTEQSDHDLKKGMIHMTDKYGYDGPEQFRPLSPWAYFGYSILFAIPLVGFILLIVFSLSNQNINRRNYARSFFCALVIVLILFGVLLVSGAAGGAYGYFSSLNRA